MRLVLISDTHGMHHELSKENQLTLPEGDVLVHAGDLTLTGSIHEAREAMTWLRAQHCKFQHIVFIAGDHDFIFESFPQLSLASTVSGSKTILHYLQNSSIVIEGVKFWGSPVTPRFMDWAFMAERGPAIAKVWALIPEDVDVLITHGPPRQILDQADPRHVSPFLGCADLLNRFLNIPRIHPKIHVFGHIHGGYGHTQSNGTGFYNASVVNEAYQVANKPFVVDI